MDLSDWLSELETRGPSAIALGLERVTEVNQRLLRARPQAAPQPLVFVVAGTNGKGSTVCYIDSVLRAAGLQCGRFSSPHLIEYAERIAVNGENASDSQIVAAFERIEVVRGEVELTYFEFGTLAALEIFRDAKLDAWVLEVGLGGRLDAVNIIDASVSVITSIDIDHQEYLGSDREVIGWEKAGIARNGRPLVLGDPEPPHSVIERADELGAPLYRLGCEFKIGQVAADPSELAWLAPDQSTHSIPVPPLPGAHQWRNVATSLAALWCAREQWPWSRSALRAGIDGAQIKGRLQRIPAHCALYLDVAHNPDGARALARWLNTQAQPGRRIYAAFALLADKDLDGVLRPMLGLVDQWAVADLNAARGRPGEQIAATIRTLSETAVSTHSGVEQALQHCLSRATANDLVIAFGSFLVAEQVLRLAAKPNWTQSLPGPNVS